MDEDRPTDPKYQRIMAIMGEPIQLSQGESLEVVLGKMGLVRKGERVGIPSDPPAKWYMTVQPADDLEGRTFYFGAVVFDIYTQDRLKQGETRKLPFSRDRYERAMDAMKEYISDPKMVIVTITPTEAQERPSEGSEDPS